MHPNSSCWPDHYPVSPFAFAFVNDLEFPVDILGVLLGGAA
jgi:hypothetical protein